MKVFTRVNGKLCGWEVHGEYTPEQVIKLLRDELGVKHKATILCLVKY